MSLTSPELMQGNTFEHEVWSIERMWLGLYATKTSAATSFSGNFMYGSQNVTTIYQPSFPQLTVTLPSSVQFGNFSYMHYDPTRWLSFSSYESPPLTEEELYDIHQGIMEIESGKAKQFNNMRETIEWLHRKRGK